MIPNHTPLPPKRWETGEHPKFDGVRSRSWFGRLLKRKKHIPMLEQAYLYLLENNDCSQGMVCADWGIDSRELRDYIKFRNNQNPEITKTAQSIINEAYVDYCLDSAQHNFVFYIKVVCHRWGLPPRPYRELWEVCPDYYPTNYIKEE